MKEVITTETTNAKRMVKKYYKQLNARKLDNIDEMELKTADY